MIGSRFVFKARSSEKKIIENISHDITTAFRPWEIKNITGL
jgi:hypothetical protein